MTLQQSVVLFIVITLFDLQHSQSTHAQSYEGTATIAEIVNGSTSLGNNSDSTTTPAVIIEYHGQHSNASRETNRAPAGQGEPPGTSLHISIVIVMSMIAILVFILTIHDYVKKSSWCNPQVEFIPTAVESPEYMDLTPQNEFSRREEQSRTIAV